VDRLRPPVDHLFGNSVRASETVSRDLFGAAERLDLEGIVAKRKADPYTPGTVWYKVKNRAYTQMEGRGDLFHPRQR
jgi:ATP-dependent DNA ligase